MKKFTWVSMTAVSLSLAAVVAGCGTGTAAAKNAGASGASASGTKLVLATSADYKPYEYHDTSGGTDKIVGFDIDIAKAIAKQLDFTVQVQDMDFNGLIGALQAGRADFVIAGMTPTAERKKSVDFSNIYYQATNIILTKKGHTVHSLNDLKGDKVAAQLGSIQETTAKSIPGVQLDSVNAIPNVVQELISNRADAVVIEDTAASGYLKQNPQLQMNKIPGLETNGSAIAFPKGSKWVAKFNDAIKTMQQDGELKQLEDKWFGGSN